MPVKLRQKLTMSVVSVSKDPSGVYEVCVLLNKKEYTFPITSEFALRKAQKLLRLKHPGKALWLLKQFTTSGFNSFKERNTNGHP